MEIVLKQDYFISVFGRPESGKTFLSRQYQMQYIQNNMKTVTVTPLKSQKDVWDSRLTLYLDNPSMSAREEASIYINKIMQLGNYTIFFDEANIVFHNYIDSSNNETDLNLARFIRQHRHRNVGAWFLTQKASKFYNEAIAYSDYVISFRQKFPTDIERLAEICGNDFAKATTELDFAKHEYVIYDMRKDFWEKIIPNAQA